MKHRSSHCLGLAFNDRSIVCGEVAIHAEQRVVRRMAVFSPAEPLFEKPDSTGQALATFLRQHRFRTSRAVVGVPARWLISGERDLPPADREQAVAVLRLHAERLSLSEQGEIVFDFSDSLDTLRGGKVLLIGIQRLQLDRLEAVLEAAGVSIAAVTPTSVALACALEQPPDQPMLVLGRGGAELVWQAQGSPRILRHMAAPSLNGHGAPALAPLGSELRRSVALAPTNGSGPPRELLLWDGVGLSEQEVGELSGRLGIAVRSNQGLASLGVQTESGADAPESDIAELYAPAMALALAGTGRCSLPLDFTHSRLAPPKRRRFGRKAVWTVALTATLASAAGALGWSLHQQQSELASLRQLESESQGPVEEAMKTNARVEYAQQYFDKRGRLLECLREVAEVFPDEGIWVTRFELRADGKGQLQGKAADQRVPLSLADRLSGMTAFSEVRTVQVTEVNAPGGRSKEQSFTISFVYRLSE